jgi:hypothetical protein
MLSRWLEACREKPGQAKRPQKAGNKGAFRLEAFWMERLTRPDYCR